MKNESVEITKENLILFDWLTFTSKIDSPSTLIELLGLDDDGISFEQMEKGQNGYRSRLMFENINILYDGAENMGCCVNITGQGCRALETYSRIPDVWLHLFRWILVEENEGDYKITRLDMALDDHTGILDIDVLRDDTDDHHYVSRSRTWEVHYGSAGCTIYHGSRKSDMLIRIYDKAAERDLDDVHWIRIELQMRDAVAKGFAQQLLKAPVGLVYRGVLHNYLRYVVPEDDTNMSRWGLTDYWSDLLEGASRISVWSAPGVDYNEWRLHNYVINQTGNALDCYLEIFGYDDLILQLGERSVRRSPKYERLKKKYKELKERGFSDGTD